MSPQQVYVLRKSFAKLEQHPQVAALIFYQRLFELAPGLRELFKHDIESQAEKFTEMLSVLIAQLDRGDELDAELRAMGARHVEYGVRPAHYGIVGRALLEMLAEVLDGAFTPEVREAWSALYEIVAERMQAGAAGLEPAMVHA